MGRTNAAVPPALQGRAETALQYLRNLRYLSGSDFREKTAFYLRKRAILGNFRHPPLDRRRSPLDREKPSLDREKPSLDREKPSLDRAT